MKAVELIALVQDELTACGIAKSAYNPSVWAGVEALCIAAVIPALPGWRSELYDVDAFVARMVAEVERTAVPA